MAGVIPAAPHAVASLTSGSVRSLLDGNSRVSFSQSARLVQLNKGGVFCTNFSFNFQNQGSPLLSQFQFNQAPPASAPAAAPPPSPAQLQIQMVVRRWERKKCKPNSLPVLQKLHVKVGDTIKVIAGSDKGKVSEITKLYRHNSKVLVKDVNLKTKHVKGKQEGEAGQIIQIEAPVHSSNVMLYSKKEKVASRVGHKELEDGRKVRFLLKTGEVLDSAEDWKRIHRSGKKEKSKTAAAAA